MSGCVPPVHANSTVLERCAGYGITSGQGWFDYWADDKCYSAMYGALYAGASVGLDAQGLNYSRCIMDKTFQRYLSTNTISESGQGGYNSFQERLLRTCARLPGTCDVALQSRVCLPLNGESADQQRARYAASRPWLNFCGCYAPPPEDARLQPTDTACDPLCARINTIQRATNTGAAKRCQQDVCVINDVSITATSSEVRGGVSFGQVCNFCSTGACTCIISSVNISGTLSDLAVTNFGQVCGATSVCLQGDASNPTAPPTLVPCADAIATAPTTTSSTTSTMPPLWVLLTLGAIVLVFILACIACGYGAAQRSYVFDNV